MKFIIDTETSGLNSIIDRITCISIFNIEQNSLKSFCEEDEKMILQQFWIFVRDNKEIITFNGDGFDLPFIIKRSVVNEVKIEKITKSIDLRKLVNSYDLSVNRYEKGTLNQWSKILGLGEKTTDGKEMVVLFNKKDWDGIRNHCEHDIKITKILYQRCKECGLI